MYTIESVKVVEISPGVQAIQASLTIDGARIDHVFPLDTLEWRIAEYGLDPADLDTVLDMVLAEPWLNDGVDQTHPQSLFNANTIGEARTFHLSRVQAWKAQHGDPAKGTAKDKHDQGRKDIKNAIVVDLDVVGMKREMVGIARDKKRAAQQAAAQAAPVPRAQHWKSMLEMTKGDVGAGTHKHV